MEGWEYSFSCRLALSRATPQSCIFSFLLGLGDLVIGSLGGWATNCSKVDLSSEYINGNLVGKNGWRNTEGLE